MVRLDADDGLQVLNFLLQGNHLLLGDGQLLQLKHANKQFHSHHDINMPSLGQLCTTLKRGKMLGCAGDILTHTHQNTRARVRIGVRMTTSKCANQSVKEQKGQV